MLKYFLLLLLKKLLTKKLFKKAYDLSKLIYSLIIFFPAILLLIVSKVIFRYTSKKILSLRISTKFLGHYTIEPAMISSFNTFENVNIITSIRPGKGIRNERLEKVIRKIFNIYSDHLIFLIEHIYNWAPKSISKTINNYYSPFIEKRNKCREISYISYLNTRLVFPWRTEARSNLKINRNEKRKIVIALRTGHFHKNSFLVSDQDYRNVSVTDLEQVIEACLKIQSINIYCICDVNLSLYLKNKNIYPKNLIFIDQSKEDVLDYLNDSTLLINNGNGVGAAAISIGVKTLYIQHTLWHFWHTSHTNGFTLPTEFYSNNKKNDIDTLMKLIFDTPDMIPFNFNKNYLKRKINIKPIKLLNKYLITNAIENSLSYETKSDNRKTGYYLGSKFMYSSDSERYFWEKYLYYLPIELRKCHNDITLKVSEVYLKSLIK